MSFDSAWTTMRRMYSWSRWLATRPAAAERAAFLVDRDLVERLVVYGTAPECRDRLLQRQDGIGTYPVISALTDDVAELLEVCAPARD